MRGTHRQLCRAESGLRDAPVPDQQPYALAVNGRRTPRVARVVTMPVRLARRGLFRRFQITTRASSPADDDGVVRFPSSLKVAADRASSGSETL